MDLPPQRQRAQASDQPAGGEAALCRPTLIAIPFYKNEHLVEPVIGSLLRCADEMNALRAEAVFFVDSPDHAPLLSALDSILPRARAAFPCRLVINPENLGFVRTMNKAVDEACRRGMDLLLLNSDTVVEPGALQEMAEILSTDHMIGFVNPRSNNATIATVPLRMPPDAPPESILRAAQDFTRRLPRLSYVPTAIGFCMLVRWSVIAEFGGFDEIYGKGYNEENDLVMRASRCGYRAVLANRAFVWHEGERSFSTAEIDRSVWEPTNRAILDARYPEYGGYTAAYYHQPETVAESLIAMMMPDEAGKLDVALDFSSFRTAHNGTYQAGLQLLQAAARDWTDRFNLHVLCTREVYEFHNYAALGVPRSDPHDGRRFAAIFRVGQPYDWNVIQRLCITAPVIGIYMLDTISIDCPQLTSSRLFNIWQFAIDHADLIATQSRQTAAQLAARFYIPEHVRQLVSLHSTDLADYRLPAAGGAPADPDGTILVIGNHFHHKYLSQTANALATALPGRTILALGLARAAGRRPPDPIEPPPLAALPNLTPLAVGALTDEEIGAAYAGCSIVVFPSHAEGFGFPVLNALAAHRPVFLRRLPVFQELWDVLDRTPNIHFYDTTAELTEKLLTPPAWIDVPFPPSDGGAARCAREIRAGLEDAIAGADYERIVRRIRAVQLTSDMSENNSSPTRPDNQAAQAAHFISIRLEHAARKLLSSRLVYGAARMAFRTTRPAWRALRRG